jgi:hypothetical protein
VPSPPTCPRCAYEPREDCQICELIRSGELPPNTVILLGLGLSAKPHRPIWREVLSRRFLTPWILAFLGAWAFAMMANIILGLFGVDDALRFVLSFPAAIGGMLLAALFIDHFTGRRRLWARRQRAGER